jgi:hypothetical protein
MIPVNVPHVDITNAKTKFDAESRLTDQPSIDGLRQLIGEPVHIGCSPEDSALIRQGFYDCCGQITVPKDRASHLQALGLKVELGAAAVAPLRNESAIGEPERLGIGTTSADAA